VWTASFYLKGAVQQWFYRFHKNQGVLTWPKFVEAINKRFGPPVRSNPLGELAHLRRMGSVDKFQDYFLKLLARCDNVTGPQQIAIFTAGLGEPMSIDVEMQKPETFEDAMALACTFERRSKVKEETAYVPIQTSSRVHTPARPHRDTATQDSDGCHRHRLDTTNAGGTAPRFLARRTLHQTVCRGDGAVGPIGSQIQI
jgi:hypothetical protein